MPAAGHSGREVNPVDGWDYLQPGGMEKRKLQGNHEIYSLLSMKIDFQL
jgi:hypothetical protein